MRSLSEVYTSTDFAYLAVEPTCFEDAVAKEEWVEVMKEEMGAIEKNNTWSLVDLPNGKDAIGLKWVYKSKFNAYDSLKRNKARLVVKGYAQIPDFLNGDLIEDVYVHQPEGFVVKGSEQKVYKLHKALYGLKQAPQAWYSKIDSYFAKSDFQKSANEPTLYVKNCGHDFLVVCFYVDDIIYTGNSLELMKTFKMSMMKAFDMTDLGSLHYFLGLEVVQNTGGIFLSQKKYVIDLLKRFGMLNCKASKTPLNLNNKLSLEDGVDKADVKLFRSMVGGLLYLTHTQPDLMFAVSLVSRFMHNPSKHHLGAAKQILRYVQGTLDLGILFLAFVLELINLLLFIMVGIFYVH
ncbi:uncharacterized protein LOC8272619 isoform X1 [Ricinus communis]|uniref:uncharacterized protein LOC8272619 isoform X1 n=1 Tax=Ricinus communis TaxID=3988 RepID=UPI00201AA0D4|nr:uncharacterized protein LOC8272619 isoform X1 [Ricinus communis]XP_048229253.1 uncharacterized protein LOC8272619 isoform X1 [Ricinus communis]XP_048229254.1 uncharacterized protein LOC8272619 isoform X1 [Ricinus communis]XP_048229255.1 uncharacterized protein LOC8272619 isoform X1 [Ricinus communis]XP_048229256.1 uncharacterized protein LOC8272619 isoform X1 [Ricinus communis]XP_048229257.1 uncharacterized protein LOC8272619 isoform X1 [Ricinus communis]XP_048229258.1 uncharacterized prot